MANKILNLDLSKDPDLPVFIYGRVGDEKMQTVTVNVTRHDQQISLEGYVITFEGTINNKIKVFDSDNVKPIDLAKGTFEYTFPSAAFSLAGTYDRAYFSIAKGELRDTTGDFKIVVSSNADITAEEAETIITEYNRLVAKLNQAFKDSVEQMESDYSELESTIEGIKGDISELTIKINNYQENVQETANAAVETINTSINNAIGEITQAVNKALQKLEAGDFYTKAAADTKFQGYQSTPIMSQDWNTITQPGVYYVNNATGINKPDSLVTTMYGFLEVINNQFSSNATVQRFISFNNEIYTRRYSGNPITWGTWESTAKTKDVVSIGDFNNTISELTSQIDEIAHDTGWVTIPVLKGSGSVKVRTYMGRTLLWFDMYIWNGNGTNAPDDAVVALPTEFQTGRMQMFEVPIWIGTPGMSDRFQLNADGRLYKLSNNSKTTNFRTFTEIF